MTATGKPAQPEFEVRTQLVNIDAITSTALQEILYQADRENRYLNDSELLRLSPLKDDATLQTLKTLRDKADEIVTVARQDLLATFPSITESGGGLYPEARAAACWRDLWHFLRCITYGIAAANPHYTNTHGLDRLRQLYQKLNVPLDAMVVALIAVKQQSLAQLPPQQTIQQEPYFDHLIDQMRSFQQAA